MCEMWQNGEKKSNEIQKVMVQQTQRVEIARQVFGVMVAR